MGMWKSWRFCDEKSRLCVKLVGTVRLGIAKLSRIFKIKQDLQDWQDMSRIYKIKQDFQDFQDCQDEEENVGERKSLILFIVLIL